MEKEFILIKPDAIQRGLIGELISRLEQKGLKIVAMRFMQLDKELAHKHYAVHKDKPFFESLVEFISSGPVVAMAVEGKNAISITRTMIGVTDPAEAAPGTVRGDMGMDIGRNLIHASDSKENAEYELDLYFDEDDYYEWNPENEKWIYE